jgi:hypothetical protein
MARRSLHHDEDDSHRAGTHTRAHSIAAAAKQNAAHPACTGDRSPCTPGVRHLASRPPTPPDPANRQPQVNNYTPGGVVHRNGKTFVGGLRSTFRHTRKPSRCIPKYRGESSGCIWKVCVGMPEGASRPTHKSVSVPVYPPHPVCCCCCGSPFPSPPTASTWDDSVGQMCSAKRGTYQNLWRALSQAHGVPVCLHTHTHTTCESVCDMLCVCTDISQKKTCHGLLQAVT